MSTVPVIEGMPDQRGLVRRGQPCTAMIAGKHDASIFGDKYLAYRYLGHSRALGARTAQTIALYSSVAEADSIFDRILTAAEQCQASGAATGTIEFGTSAHSVRAWTYRVPTSAGGADRCAVDARAMANVVFVVEVCHTGKEVPQAALIADSIAAKFHSP